MDTAIILLIGAALALTAAGFVNGDKRLSGAAALAAIAAAALWAYGALLPAGNLQPPETATLQQAAPKPAPQAEPEPIPATPAPEAIGKKQIYDRIGESGEITAD